MSLTHSQCVSACLGIQYAIRMRRIVMCGLSYSIIFFHISHKRQGFREKQNTEYKMCFDFLYNILTEALLVLRRSKEEMIKTVYWASCKLPIISVSL